MPGRRLLITLGVTLGLAAGGSYAVGSLVLKLSENPSFCHQVCHVMAPYYESYSTAQPRLLAYAHAQAGVICKDCHHTDLRLQAREVLVTISGRYESPLTERQYDSAMCLACHTHSSGEQIIALTRDVKPANPHDSHWGLVECRLCHKMHRTSTDYCAQCHDHGFHVP